LSADARWLELLERSTTSRVVVNGVELPTFPPEELQVRTIGSAGIPAIREAFRFYSLVRDISVQQGQRLQRTSRVLDFGMGWGRTIRCFLNDVAPEGLYGADVSDEFLAAAQQSRVPGAFSRIDAEGSLPHDDSFFDVVYAYSVFTHLPERTLLHWLSEISRVLKPTGLLVATVEPRRFLEHCLTVDLATEESPRDRKVALALKARADALPSFDRDGFLFLPTSGEGIPFGNAAMSAEYVQRRWAEWFIILDYLDEPRRFRQAVVSARNRRPSR
jgi:SAM-dependent methyltransferase